MHPRNPYKIPPDFALLIQAYPPLASHVYRNTNGTLSLNFKDPDAQRTLTQALLHRDFNLSINLPENRLCPPVPNRLNYLLWIEDVLRSTDASEAGPSSLSSTTGIDIGTGASSIYPLLGCKTNPQWEFVATELDEESFGSAIENVRSNSMGDRIHILRSHYPSPILTPFSHFPSTQFDFTMCNPPFYRDAQEVVASNEMKLYPPNAVCTGAEIEMITPGGESAFVRQMVAESGQYRDRCRWYTSMLGKLSSVTEVVEAIREQKIDNYGISELVQGNTRRWVVAWSYGGRRLPNSLSRFSSDTLQGYMPLPNCLRFSLAQQTSTADLREKLEAVLAALEDISFIAMNSMVSFDHQMEGEMDELKLNGEPSISLRISASRNTWSRAARRKKGKPESNLSAGFEGDQQLAANKPALTCDILLVSDPSRASQAPRPPALECRWIEGLDRSLFESFWSHVTRKLSASVGG